MIPTWVLDPGKFSQPLAGFQVIQDVSDSQNYGTSQEQARLSVYGHIKQQQQKCGQGVDCSGCGFVFVHASSSEKLMEA